ncbi:MAG: COX15/CtaA family protein [Acidimicrobiales bacterium]
MLADRLSPQTYRRITLAALVALAFIVVTGSLVRLTGSGLGCPSWPTCDEGRIVAPLEYHALIEFVNRLVTGLVSVAVMLAVLGSLARRPRRRDLTWLSLGLVAGVIGQIVLGGLVVLFHLFPPLVMGHFVLSMLLIWCATVLHHRAGEPDGGERRPAVGPEFTSLARLLVAMGGLAILLGTVVTGSGPHAGSRDGELVERLPLAVRDVTRFHGVAAMLFLAAVVVTVVRLRREGNPRVERRAQVLLAVLAAQAGVGYLQYFTGVPALLVAVHIAGATAVWVATIRLSLATTVAVPNGLAPPSEKLVLA